MNFRDHLKTYLSEKEIDQLLESLKDENKHAVLLNPSKMSDETFLSLYPNVVKHPIVPHAYIYNKGICNLGKSIYHTLGCFYLQEPSAMIPAYLLCAQENDLVLDMCAAPGGKTIQTSFLLGKSGLIIANDLSRSRCSSIVENEERLGLGNIVVTNNDLSLIYQKLTNTFDKIILDAPCSGSGMFRKDNKMEEDWSYNKVLKYAETQKQLILIAYEMLKPGGKIVYSTCSFSYEEDEEVIKHLLDNTDAEIEDIEDNALFYKNKDNHYGIHLFPHLFPGEGHYICLIKKPGICLNKPVKEVDTKNKYGIKMKNIYQFGEYLFGLNYSYPFKCFNIVRMGVKIGEIIKSEIRYDYHYAHYVEEFPKIAINNDEIELYLKGNTLNSPLQKGTYLLTYKGINVDITKADGRIIKNHLPKVYRH